MSKHPSPGFSRFLSNQGYQNVKLTHYDRQQTSKPSIVKITMNKSSSASSSLQKTEPNQGSLSARKRVVMKPANTRSGVLKLSLFALRPCFQEMKLNYRWRKKEEGKQRMGKLMVKGRIRRLESGYYELFRNCKRMKRLEVFVARLVKLYRIYEVSREKVALGRLCMSDNKILSKLKRNDLKNKVLSFEGLMKRLESARVKSCMGNFKELGRLFRAQNRQVRKVEVMFRNVLQRNLVGAFHKLAVWRKPIKPQKSSRSIPKPIKTEEKEPINPFEQKYNQLEQDYKRMQLELKSRQKQLVVTVGQRDRLEKEVVEITSRVNDMENQNRLLSSKVEIMSQEQNNLRSSRHTHRSEEEEYDDEREQNESRSVNSQVSHKSAYSNLSGKSFVQNASMLAFHPIYLSMKQTGKSNPFISCCGYKQQFQKLEISYNDLNENYKTLEMEIAVLNEKLKYEKIVGGKQQTPLSEQQLEKVKVENMELRASLEIFKGRAKELKKEKEVMKKEYHKRLEEILQKVIKSKSIPKS